VKSARAHDIIASTNQEEPRTMAKRKNKPKASPTPASDTSVQAAPEPAAKPTRKSARKTAAKPARKGARKSAVKPRPKKHLSRADRTRILAEAKSKGWTAEQIARKAGVSKWTVYGWNKRSAAKGGRTTVKRGRPGRPARQATGSLAEMLRPLIAEMVRVELARLVGH
jgi:hypothetical protein